jgi:4-hydroxy-3-methylbut-2-enyl diphosphate reductase
MRIIKAKEMGMCFGVRDALDAARQIDRPVDVTVYGQLVHNPQVNDELRGLGFQLQGELKREQASPPTQSVMITAHGISDKRRRQLTLDGKQLIDTTCPLVRHVHEVAQRFAAEDRCVIVIGRHGHVEVRGVVEDLKHFMVVQNPAEVRSWAKQRIGVVCQSTVPPDLARAVQERIKALNYGADIQFADTICRPTRERLESLRALLDQVDAVVVVGGRNSNNTNQLAARAQDKAICVVRIESADELRPDMFTGCDDVGLTAGTSTPDHVIDQVHNRLLEMTEPSCPVSARRKKIPRK